MPCPETLIVLTHSPAIKRTALLTYTHAFPCLSLGQRNFEGRGGHPGGDPRAAERPPAEHARVCGQAGGHQLPHPGRGGPAAGPRLPPGHRGYPQAPARAAPEPVLQRHRASLPQAGARRAQTDR
eukprot:5112880-Pyramimonas_sp.AAC.1